MKRDLLDDRLALGMGGIFPVSLAARLLPVADARARVWLHERGLVVPLEGRPVVIWGDVVRALSTESEPCASPSADAAVWPRTALGGS